jgi:YVTN family beta-propeller protein
MKKSIFVLFIFASIIFFNSCSEEEIIQNNPPGQTGGIHLYILNEGSSAGTGKLSLYKSSNDSMYESIYSGTLSYPDGLYLDGGNLLVVEQGASFGGPGKIYKLDMNGNLNHSSQPFGTSPYSLAVVNNKIYVTNGPGSSVSVLERNTFTLLNTISVGVYPQEILAQGNKVFVCNTSAFGGASDSTISVINALTDSVISTLVLRREVTSVFYKSGTIFAGCSSAGMIYRIDTSSLAKIDSFSIVQGFDKDISFGSDGNSINFIDGNNNITKLDFVNRTATTVVTNPDPVNNYFYGYTYIDKHYILDAKNFVLNGKLYIYSTAGALEKTFTTGVAPRKTAFAIIAILPD